MTMQELFKKADLYKEKINENLKEMKSIDTDILKEIDQYFRVSFTYSSNALEGNMLTFLETKTLMEDNNLRTKQDGKDCFHETIGHGNAYDYMLLQGRVEELVIREDLIKQLHYLFYNKVDIKEAGTYRKNDITDTKMGYLPPSAEDVPRLMEHFINQMDNSKRFMHPIEYAAMCHKRILDIQPFQYGNGIIARLFMNLILVNEGYGIVIIPPTRREDYLNALMASREMNHIDIDTFIKFIAECLIESEKEYCKLLKINL